MIRAANVVEGNVVLKRRDYLADVTYETAIDREGAVREFVVETLDSLKD